MNVKVTATKRELIEYGIPDKDCKYIQKRALDIPEEIFIKRLTFKVYFTRKDETQDFWYINPSIHAKKIK